MSEASRDRTPLRHPEILIAPGITFLAVVGILAIARFYGDLPVRAPECAFRERFAIPCAGCGGTRSMQALSRGNIGAALRFHPAAVIGVFASLLWMLRGIRRYCSGESPTPPEKVNRLFLRGVAFAVAMIFLNWIYLIFFLP